MIFSAFLIGASTAFFTIFAVHILLFMPQRTQFQTTVGIIMAVWALWCAKDLVICMPGMYRQDVLDWILIIDGWSAITYTVFIFEVVMPGWTTRRRLLLLCLPFLLFTVCYALLTRREVVLVYSAFLWCYAWTIVFIGWTRMNKYLKFLRREYSDIEGIDVSWLRPVFLFAIIGQLAWLFTSLYSNTACDIVYYISTIVLWLVVLHYSWNFHPIRIENGAEETEMQTCDEGQCETTGNVSANDSRNQLPFSKLEKLMEEQKSYLNPTLTLKELAHDLNTNRTYISSCLNQQMNMTFYDYINRLRIERAAIPLLKAHPEYKFEYVASESGFASISTFRRAFVKVTGQTPRQYAAGLLTGG